MKRKTKDKKGISLIVLVITIIVMIILAATIIISLSNNGIIDNAKNAVGKTNVANVKTAADLVYAEYLLGTEKLTDEKLEEKITNELIKKGTITGKDYYIKMYDDEVTVITVGSVADKFYKGEIKIGDYVEYNPAKGVTNASSVSYTSPKTKNGYANQVFTLTGSYNNSTYGWQVIGVGKDGSLLLLSEDFIQPTSGGRTYNEREFFVLSGKKSDGINETREVYLSVEGELNNICAIFGKGYGATGARCITIEDVDKITRYNPKAVGNIEGNVFKKGEIGAYKNTVTYYWYNNEGIIEVYYEGANEAKGSLTKTHTAFEWYEGSTYHKETAPTTEELAEGKKQKITTLKSNYFVYYPETLTDSNTSEEVGLVKSGTLAYDVLFTDGRGVNTNCWYWLASSYSYTSSAYARFGIHDVRTGKITGGSLFRSSGVEFDVYDGIRAVVSLDAYVSLSLVEGAIGNETANRYAIK